MVALLFVMLVGGYLILQSSIAQTFITKQFTNHLSNQTNAKISIGKVDIALFNKVILNDFLIEGQNNDTIIYTQKVFAKIDTLKIRKQRISIAELTFKNNKIGIERDSINHFNFSFFLDSLNFGNDTTAVWKIKCSQFGFQQTVISYSDSYSKNIKNIFLNDLDVNISEFDNYNDTIRLKLNQLNFNDGKNLELKELSANLMATSGMLEIDSLNVKSARSELSNSILSFKFRDEENTPLIKPSIDFRISNSNLSLLEIAELVPNLRGMDQSMKMSGRIYGTIDDLKGKNLTINTGKDTKALVDFYINGIENPETMYLFFDLKRSTTTFSDLSDIKLPKTLKFDHLKFPESFYEAGLLRFTGNFSGFIRDFVTFGTLESGMGLLKTDISVVPKEDGTVRYRGRISTNDFQLGELLKNNSLGHITFNGEVDGNYNGSTKTLGGLFKGDIWEMELNKYTYENIGLDGLYLDKMFDGLLTINDPNLKLDFQGQIDLNLNTPDFNFILDLKKLRPQKLNLTTKFPDSELALKLKAKFSGNKIDDLKGVILVNEGNYNNFNGNLKFNNLQLISDPTDSTRSLSFTSDFFDIEVDGDYHFETLTNAFKQTINRFLPAVNYQLNNNARPNVFDYRINIKNLDSLTNVFYPDLKFETPFLLYGKMASDNIDFELEGSVPGIEYKDLWFRNIFISNKVIDNHYSSKFKFGEILHRNGMKIYDFTIDSDVEQNNLNSLITWNQDQDSTKHSTIQLNSNFSPSNSSIFPHIIVESVPSTIFLTDTTWQFEKFTTTIDSSTVSIKNFNLYNGGQQLTINGNIGKSNSKQLSVDFNDFDLSYFQKNLKNKISGIANCTATISGLYTQPYIISNIDVDDFVFAEHPIGNINLTSNWDQGKTLINTELKINKSGKQNLYAFGNYNLDSRELDFDAHADSLPLTLLGAAITKNLSDFQGYATGIVKFGGSIRNLKLNGALNAENAGLKVDYTQTNYTFSDSIFFIDNIILFDNITIKDSRFNTGIFDGTLKHTNFKNMIYDLTISSPKILALNTEARNNEQLYGKVYAHGKLDITGQGKTVSLNGSATTLSGTDVNISMEYEGDIEQYDFFEFKSTETIDKVEQFFKKPKSDLNISLTVEATPDAKVQLIYNSRIGDIIRATGEGILLFEMNKDGDISLSGDYSVVEGDYLFTLENVINKRFSIEQGGSIVWSGDPYNAIINLAAIYKIKAALYDLMMESYLLQGEDIYQRIPVECKILLSEELTNPVINFEIDFPNEDESLVGILQQFINTEEELNKQILSLIVMGKFYTPEYLRGQYETQNPNTIGNTASELFSNQLSNWLSQISSDVDVGFNYRPGNSITNDEIELALSTQIFNDRVTLNGNIGNNVNPESNNSSQIVGDFDIKAKLVPSGKIQFKAFNRSNNNLIYETAPYTQGVGLSFKEEYNSIEELLKKIGLLFKKKK